MFNINRYLDRKADRFVAGYSGRRVWLLAIQSIAMLGLIGAMRNILVFLSVIIPARRPSPVLFGMAVALAPFVLIFCVHLIVHASWNFQAHDPYYDQPRPEHEE